MNNYYTKNYPNADYTEQYNELFVKDGVKLGFASPIEPCLIMKEHYISKKGVPTISTIKFKAIGKEVQVFNNNGFHRTYFRMSQEQVKEFKEWLDAIDK